MTSKAKAQYEVFAQKELQLLLLILGLQLAQCLQQSQGSSQSALIQKLLPATASRHSNNDTQSQRGQQFVMSTNNNNNNKQQMHATQQVHRNLNAFNSQLFATTSNTNRLLSAKQGLPLFSANQAPPYATMCHLPEEQMVKNCPLRLMDFKVFAIESFKRKLLESSSDLRMMLESYSGELSAMLGELSASALRNTHSKLSVEFGSQQQQQLALAQNFTDSFFISMSAHLLNPAATGSSRHAQIQRPFNRELAHFLKQLQLVEVKAALDSRLELQPSGSRQFVSFECLSRQVEGQHQLDAMLASLASNSSANSKAARAALQLDVQSLAHSLRQSTDFARALLTTLSASRELLASLTGQLNAWMHSEACHAALVHMLVCPSCASAPTHSHLSLTHPQLNALSNLRLTPLSRPQVAPPCEGLCLNVARGCMTDVYELQRFWADLATSLARFQRDLVLANNFENIMSNVDTKIVALLRKVRAIVANSQAPYNGRQGAGNHSSTGDQFEAFGQQLTSQVSS